MNLQNEEPDFSIPSFQPYVSQLDEEYQEHIEFMLKEAFSSLSKSEKLMMKPLIEVYHLKVEQREHLLKKDEESKKNLHRLEKKIKAHLDVLNENGDIHVLIKRFNLTLLEGHKKKSSKQLALLGAESMMKFIQELKANGELKS